MALLPKYRQRLVKGILEYHARGKETGGRLYRYQKVASAAIFISTLIFVTAWQYQIIPSQYTPYFVLTFVIVILASGTVLTTGLLKIAGKWGLLLIAIITAITVLRILT
ncbi:MAG: hypothetical protein U9O89_03180 [Thermoproteota archaeon]|nr:hypothetical protein [Thermoproteota archaeon]